MAFVANARAELLPPEGPVHINIENYEDLDVENRAQRVEKFLNTFFTEIAEEFYPDCENAFFWCALYGSVFKKTYFDPILKRPTSPFIKPEDFVVNYGITSLSSATRMTHVLRLTKKELKLRQLKGMYRNIPLAPQDDLQGSENSIRETLNQIEGYSPTTFEYNEEYVLYECHCDLVIDGENNVDENGERSDIPVPYIVTIDSESRKVLSIYRNWDEKDHDYQRIDCFSHYQFLPGLGVYGYGFTHMAGGCAKAATILTRQLIDAGMLSNFPGGLRVKGMHFEDNNIRVGPTEFIEIETGGLPIDQAIMMMPYKEPSPTLMALKDKMEENISRFSGIANQQLADFNTNAPVGTVLALLEQSHRLQSSVMRRLHAAMTHEFRLFYGLFDKYLKHAPYPFTTGPNGNMIMGNDFRNDLKIVPVSDPNVSSSTQRLVRNEALLRFAQQNPELHNIRAVYERIYKEMKIPNIDKILPPPQDAPPIIPLDPVTENSNLMVNKPVVAGIWQDHEAHIIVHSQLLNDPSQAQIAPLVNAHIQEHQAMAYQLRLQQMMQIQLPPDPSQLSPEEQNQVALLASQAVQQSNQESQQAAPSPIDPSLVMLEDIKVKHEGVQQRAQADLDRTQVALQKIEFEREKFQLEYEAKLKEIELKNENEKLKMELDKYKAELNATKNQSPHEMPVI